MIKTVVRKKFPGSLSKLEGQRVNRMILAVV